MPAPKPQTSPFAIDVTLFQNRIVSPFSTLSRRMGDYIGPPSPRFIEAEATEAPRRLAVAQTWREDFFDEFNRAELGGAWEALSGGWTIRNGVLVASGDREDKCPAAGAAHAAPAAD